MSPLLRPLAAAGLLAGAMLLALPLPAAAQVGGLPGLAPLAERLAPAEEAWLAVLASAEHGSELAPRLAPPLAAAVLELEACACVDEAQPALAALAATAIEAARSAGAPPERLLELELALRENLSAVLLSGRRLPAIEADAGPSELTRAELALALGPPTARHREEIRQRLRELRPAELGPLPEAELDRLVAEGIRRERGAALPEAVARSLFEALAQGRPENLR